MNSYNRNTPESKKRIQQLKDNFLHFGSTNKSMVIRETAKELGINPGTLQSFYYTASKDGVKFFQLTEEDGTKYPINTKNVLQSKNTSEDKDSFLKLVLSKLSKEDLAEIILASHK